MTAANTWYDGPSVELGEGTWMVSGALLVLGTAAMQGITARISDGTTHHASAEFSYGDNVGYAITLSLPRREVALAVTTTIKLQAASTVAGAVIKAATTVNGSGNNASWITAERVG